VAHGQACPFGTRKKQLLDMERLYPKQVVSSCTPRVLIFPKIVVESTSRLIPLGKAETLLRLIRHSALVLIEPHLTPRHIEVLKQLVNQTQSYELLAGQDLKREPLAISNYLSELFLEKKARTA